MSTCSRCGYAKTLREIFGQQVMFQPLMALLATPSRIGVGLQRLDDTFGRLLREMVARDERPTHAWLDKKTQNGAVTRLRALLITAGILPAIEDNGVARLATVGMSLLTASQDRLHASDYNHLRRFITWYAVQRARKTRRLRHDTHQKYRLRLIGLAVEYTADAGKSVACLENFDRDFFDNWIAPRSNTDRRHLVQFIRWLWNNRIQRACNPSYERAAEPRTALSSVELKNSVESLLHDSAVPLRFRVAGLFAHVGLMGTQIVAIKKDHVSEELPTSLFIGGWLELAPALAVLVRELKTNGDPSALRWRDYQKSKFLFPGILDDSPMNAAYLATALKKYGHLLRRPRNMFFISEALLGNPLLYLTRPLRLNDSTAYDWGNAANGANAKYVSQKSPRPLHDFDISDDDLLKMT